MQKKSSVPEPPGQRTRLELPPRPGRGGRRPVDAAAAVLAPGRGARRRRRLRTHLHSLCHSVVLILVHFDTL